MCAFYAILFLILYTFFDIAMLKRNLDYLYVLFFNRILCSYIRVSCFYGRQVGNVLCSVTGTW
jgi:hypothetical protein